MTARVLIVDDEANIVISLDFLMRQQGFETAIANNGVDALAALEDFEPDLVLLDVSMPLLDGFGVVQRIREGDRPETKVIMLTAKGQDAEVKKGLALGADLYVTKPFSTRDLVDSVVNLLAET